MAQLLVGGNWWPRVAVIWFRRFDNSLTDDRSFAVRGGEIEDHAPMRIAMVVAVVRDAVVSVMSIVVMTVVAIVAWADPDAKATGAEMERLSRQLLVADDEETTDYQSINCKTSHLKALCQLGKCQSCWFQSCGV